MGSFPVADREFASRLKSFKSLRLGGTQPFLGQGTSSVVRVTFESPVFGRFEVQPQGIACSSIRDTMGWEGD